MAKSPVAVGSVDVGAAVQTLKPELQHAARMAALIIAALVVAVAAWTVWAISLDVDGESKIKIAGFVWIIAAFLIAAAYRRMRRTQESLVMPIVARAVGLSYDKQAKDFLDSLPERLLPGSAIKTAEDHVYGKIGNHRIQMAEAKVETGGKNSRTLFKGVVAQFDNSVAMPAFLLAPIEQTRPGVILKAWIPTDGLFHLRDVTGPSGEIYGVWTAWSDRTEPPALGAVIEILTSLPSRMTVQMTLFSATSDGTEMHLALEHQRDLFRVGGFFPDEAGIFSDVEAATRDMSVPLGLVQALLTAEAAVVEKDKAAPLPV